MVPESNFTLVRKLTLARIADILVLPKYRMQEYTQTPYLPLCKQFHLAEAGASTDRACRFCPLHDRGVRNCCREMAYLVSASRGGIFTQFLYSVNRLYLRISRLKYDEYVNRYHFYQPVSMTYDGNVYLVCRTGDRRKLMPGEWGLTMGSDIHLVKNTTNEATGRYYDVVHLSFRDEREVKIAG